MGSASAHVRVLQAREQGSCSPSALWTTGHTRTHHTTFTCSSGTRDECVGACQNPVGNLTLSDGEIFSPHSGEIARHWSPHAPHRQCRSRRGGGHRAMHFGRFSSADRQSARSRWSLAIAWRPTESERMCYAGCCGCGGGGGGRPRSCHVHRSCRRQCLRRARSHVTAGCVEQWVSGWFWLKRGGGARTADASCSEGVPGSAAEGRRFELGSLHVGSVHDLLATFGVGPLCREPAPSV
jgi:hypothetical protein